MASRQGGAALLVLLAVLALGASWFMVSRLDALSADLTARNRQYNAAVLLRAKQALMGYVAAQAIKEDENNPGSLPCPEDPGNFDSASGGQGLIGTNCATTVKVGRFPWRTLGLDTLVDAHGEPLWYAVSPNWSYNIGTNSVINSNSVGNLTVDGVANAAVAVIIAPGPAFSVPACGANAAINQVRALAGTPDWRNYLECENGSNPTDTTFVTTGATGSFNDQVMVVTAADMLPGIEAAIASRIEREVLPKLKAVFNTNSWAANISATRPLLPYPAPFANPTTSSYSGSKGAASTSYAGLLPVNLTEGCVPATEPRCVTPATGSSTLLTYAKNGDDTFQTLLWPLPLGWIRTQSTCTWSGVTYSCTGEYQLTSIRVTVTLRVANVAMGFRTLDLSGITCTAVDDSGGGIPLQNIGCLSRTFTLQSDGSGLITVVTNWTPDIVTSGWGTYANYTVNFPRSIFGDPAVLDPTDATSPDTRWFWRNEWYRLLYYVVASGNTADALPTAPSCVTTPPCLPITNVATTQNGALLILAGRSINGSARPSATLGDYLESGNASGSFIKLPVNTAAVIPAAQRFNDRIFAVSSN